MSYRKPIAPGRKGGGRRGRKIGGNSVYGTNDSNKNQNIMSPTNTFKTFGGSYTGHTTTPLTSTAPLTSSFSSKHANRNGGIVTDEPLRKPSDLRKPKDLKNSNNLQKWPRRPNTPKSPPPSTALPPNRPPSQSSWEKKSPLPQNNNNNSNNSNNNGLMSRRGAVQGSGRTHAATIQVQNQNINHNNHNNNNTSNNSGNSTILSIDFRGRSRGNVSFNNNNSNNNSNSNSSNNSSSTNSPNLNPTDNRWTGSRGRSVGRYNKSPPKPPPKKTYAAVASIDNSKHEVSSVSSGSDIGTGISLNKQSKRRNGRHSPTKKGNNNNNGDNNKSNIGQPFVSKPFANGHNSKKDDQIVGDIMMHYDSWQRLLTGKTNTSSTHRWKDVFAVLEDHSIRFWEQGSRASQASDITIFLSEIVGISKSIRSIDGAKDIIDIDLCGSKCQLAFGNVEMREFWYGTLSHFYWDYFMWRSAPLDSKHRRSQNTVIGFHKVVTNQNLTSQEASGVEYVDDVLDRVNKLPNDIYKLVPPDCVAQGRRFERALMAVRYFLMSALKSVSGADVPLPSTESLTEFLEEIESFKWDQASAESLDYLIDRLYRLQINLSFALSAVCRDEIMRLREYQNMNDNNELNNDSNSNSPTNSDQMNKIEKRTLAELKYEYECLQRSWKVHRERLQEYVAAYGDAVARLKYSYYKRDQLCKKIEDLAGEKKEVENAHAAVRQQLQQLTQTIPILFNTLNLNATHSQSVSQTSISPSPNHSIITPSPNHGIMSPLPKQLVIDIPQMNDSFALNNNSNNLSATGNNANGSSNLSKENQLRIQKLSLDLIRLRAEQEMHNLLHPNDPNISRITMKIQNLENQIRTLQGQQDQKEKQKQKQNSSNDSNRNNSSLMRQYNGNNSNGIKNTTRHKPKKTEELSEIVGLLEQQMKSLMTAVGDSNDPNQSQYSRQQQWDYM